MKKITALRGMKDITPAQAPYWQHIERAAREVLAAYGYREIRPPVVERTDLFRRSVGEGTDIVDKEMYTFEDRDGDNLCLRPECTASCVRAAIEHNWLRDGGQRVWHMGPMFRYERPQQGRYRQFHQLDVEALGFAGPDVDAELIALSRRLFTQLDLGPLTLELNCLGSREAQSGYRERLVAYMSDNRDALDEDSVRRLETNPLRILDSKSKDPAMVQLLAEAPAPVDHLDETSAGHFEGLRAMLEEAHIAYRLNRRLVRGLDYYTGTVFEWTTEALGAQNAVCGGGRYDKLFAEIGGADAPAIGFAMGLERLVALAEAREQDPPRDAANAYLLAVGDDAVSRALGVGEALRDADLAVVVDAGAGSFKAKIKRADRSGARFALILGAQEASRGQLGVKDLRRETEQRNMAQADVADYLQRALREPPA
ncbi:MAG: histidine--tRNA ligase [Gammaproteobacteria bacterium]